MTMPALGKGNYLELLSEDDWEYVRRYQATGVAVIMAKTNSNELLLVEQYRKPVQSFVIELPAGLVGDQKDNKNESSIEAARRELLEETGYYANQLQLMLHSPSSSGLTNEMLSVYLASELEKKHSGGGDESEQIKVHVVPINGIHNWLKAQLEKKKMIDYKIYIALYFFMNQANNGLINDTN